MCRDLSFWGVLLLSATVTGCDCAAEEPCVDPDRDGFGPHCAHGADCDETNPLRNVDCDAVPPPDCDSQAVQPGCVCFTHRPNDCYLGPAETRDVGTCTAGVIECLSGHWGLCVGQTLPAPERCDGQDEDCDGIADDGVQSPCGGCDPGCVGGVIGEGGAVFAPDQDPSDDVEVASDGALVLSRVSTTTDSLWVANSGEDTVSRIDTATGVEVARYASGGDDPSRTAVDYLGDAYVANRAMDGQATVAKLAAIEEHCVDRDLDGVIDTSHAPDEVLPADEEECLLWIAPVGAPGAIARALAVDDELGLDDSSAGDPWVGLWTEQRVLRLDPLSGAILRSVDTPGVHPYGAAVAADGALWVVERDGGRLARIDTHDPGAEATIVEQRLACAFGYGIAADPAGPIWLGGWACGDLRRYDPARDRWDYFRTAASVRGVAIDDAGRIVAAHTGGFVTRFDPTAETLERVDLDDGVFAPLEAVGVAIDAGGQTWAVSRVGGPDGHGVASRVDFDTGNATGLEVGVDPYTYSDMTGHALRAVLQREGWLAHVFDGCDDGPTRWIALHENSLLPAGATIAFEARHAADAAALDGASFAALGTVPADEPPFALDFPEGGVVEVRVTLYAGQNRATPRLTRLGVEWSCPGPD